MPQTAKNADTMIDPDVLTKVRTIAQEADPLVSPQARANSVSFHATQAVTGMRDGVLGSSFVNTPKRVRPMSESVGGRGSIGPSTRKRMAEEKTK